MLAHLLDDDDDAHLRCASAATSTRIVDESSRARCSDGLRKTRGPGRKAASLQRALVAFEKCARACETSRHAPSTCPDRSRPPHARCPQRPPCCEALSRGNFGAFSTRHSGQFTPDSTNHGLSDTLNHGLSDTLMASLTLSDTSCGAVPAFSNLEWPVRAVYSYSWHEYLNSSIHIHDYSTRGLFIFMTTQGSGYSYS